MPQSDTDIVNSLRLTSKPFDMKTKKKNDELLALAARALRECPDTIVENGSIKASYNGQIAAFCVSVAMSGIKPTLAFYMSNSESQSSSIVDKRKIVSLLAWMIVKGGFGRPNESYQNAGKMFQSVVNSEEPRLAELRKTILDCAVALKQMVRTYNLIES